MAGAGDRIAAFAGSGAWAVALVLAGLCVLVLTVPLGLWLAERGRWGVVRGMLADAALRAHLSVARAARIVDRQLFDAGEAPPLTRLRAMQAALAEVRGAGTAFRDRATLAAAAADARTLRLLWGAAEWSRTAEEALAELVRLYLGEAEIERASNVVHGADRLGYADRQLVAPEYLAALEAIAAAIEAGAPADRLRIERALSRRRRRAQRAALDEAAADTAGLVAAIRSFAMSLQPIDPDSPAYRTRATGGGPRSLDALIARFDRGGTVA